MEDLNWQILSGRGWPQLRECTYAALVACERLTGNPVADALREVIHAILADGAHDPATRVTLAPPAELLRLMADMAHERASST